MLVLCSGIMLTMAAPQEAHANTVVCTKQLDTVQATDGEGMIAKLITEVKNHLNTAAYTLFYSFPSNAGFVKAVWAGAMLMVVIWGIMIAIGAIPYSATDTVVRIAKLGAVLSILTSAGFYYGFLTDFFIDGVDTLILQTIGEAVSRAFGITIGSNPLSILDQTAATVLSPKMFITILASLGTGPWGIIFAIFLIMGFWSFMGALASAAWIYLMSLIARYLLVGLFPIFICFLLFQRTRHLFDGWINQMVNYSLQPLFLFLFITMYVVLMQTAMQKFTNAEFCYVSFESITGIPIDIKFWRYECNNAPDSSPWLWVGRMLDQGLCNIPGIGDVPDKSYPIDIVHVLSFFLLANLAWKISIFAADIAREISGSQIYLSQMPGVLHNQFEQLRGKVGAGADAAVRGQKLPGGQRGVGGPAAFFDVMNRK